MKIRLYKWLLVFSFALFGVTSGLAWHGNGNGWHGGNGWNGRGWNGSNSVVFFSVGSGYYNYPAYNPYYQNYYSRSPYYNNYNPAYGYRSCAWVSGHYEYGYWVPRHRACWY